MIRRQQQPMANIRQTKNSSLDSSILFFWAVDGLGISGTTPAVDTRSERMDIFLTNFLSQRPSYYYGSRIIS
jgi:hypothetical protein